MKLNFKLLLIPILVLVSLFYTSFIFSTKIDILKKQIDTIYFGNFITTNRLHSIISSYKNILINNNSINLNKENILKKWNEYLGQYKTIKERETVSKLNISIMESFNKNDKLYFKHIISQIELLLEYETVSASIQRKSFLKNYENMKNYLLYNQIFIFSALILLLFYIIYGVVKSNNNLEILSQKYKIDSITDSLTKLYNRKYFDNLLDNLSEISKQNNYSSTFIMIDIDYFKQYNDIYGHQKGDDALICVSQLLTKTFEDEYQYCCRIGGEEFAVLLFDTNTKLVKSKLEELQNNIKEQKIEHSASKSGFLTLSMGVVLIDKSNYDMIPKDIYKLADSKLYNSKENGRDQYTI
ncbi:MAG: GGDEF domain-containing protein [Campylobacterota bacterium]|nr:GGDEF domain-containing protein [Campylobacterota bacterium]